MSDQQFSYRCRDVCEIEQTFNGKDEEILETYYSIDTDPFLGRNRLRGQGNCARWPRYVREGQPKLGRVWKESAILFLVWQFEM